MERERVLEICALVSFLGVLVSYFFLPGKVPIHWGPSGAIDAWGHKANILWMGGLPVAFTFLFRLLPRLDPLRAAYAKHARAYAMIQYLLTAFFVAQAWIAIAAGFGLPLKVAAVLRGGVGLLFVGMGNFMGQLKRNYFIGIRTPWALADDEVWRRTHRRGAWVFVILGIAFFASAFIPDRIAAIGFAPAVLAAVAYIFAYSYLAFRAVKRGAGKEAS